MIPGPEVDAVLDGLLELPAGTRRAVLERLGPSGAAVVGDWARYSWRLWARPKQLLPAGAWRYCIMLAGRSWGKNRAAAEAVRAAAESGAHPWISVVGPTMTNVLRDMIGGPSGILAVSPPWFAPTYQPSRAQLVYPVHPLTGVRTRVALLSADRPERVRGSQCSFAWLDEPQSWTHAEEALEMLNLSLRLGDQPRAVVTMTPRPNEVTRSLVLGPKGEDGVRRLPASTVVVKGDTFENTSLSPDVLDELRRRYEGTRLGRQELYAEILERPAVALFTEDTINTYRVDGQRVRLTRIVLAVDPSRSRHGGGDLAGGCVVGLGEDRHLYVLEDATIRATPLGWVRHFAGIYNKYSCTLGVYEQNRLDDALVGMIRTELQGQHWEPRTAAETKAQRLEPVAAAAERGLIHFVGSLPELEEQLLAFDPTEPKHQADDRVDAFAWACRELLNVRARPPLITR